MDSTGKQELLYSARTMSLAPHYSPDGKRLVFASGVPGADIWVKDPDHDAASRLTFVGPSAWPMWSADGKGVFFSNYAESGLLYWIRSDGAGGPQALSDSVHNARPYSISPDGKYLALEQSVPNGSQDIFIASIDGSAAHPTIGKLEPFLSTPAQEMSPAFSPDGRWIAYSSNESGTFEVYVRPFPGPGGRWQVSTSGGIHPRWSAKTHELLYQTSTREVVRVEYSATAESFSPGRSRLWPSVQLADAGPNAVFDISPDGKHLAAVLPVVPAGGSWVLSEVTFLGNLFDELKRRAPGR